MNPPPPSGDRAARRGLLVKRAILASAVALSVLVIAVNLYRPRTDDAFVTANVVGLAPRVSGPIVRVAVADNRFVRQGDLLFEVDPTPYRHAVDRAAAQQKQAEATLDRTAPLLPKAFVTPEQVDNAEAARRVADANLASARYDLESCRVAAPFDGYVVNLNLSEGAFAHAGAEVLTLVDARNWYVIANFRESALRHVAPGMGADVFVMSRPGVRYHGVVDGVGRAVVPQELPQFAGLPNVKRELNWVHLAQRFPVRIRLDAPPADPGLRVGATAVVTVTGHGRGD